MDTELRTLAREVDPELRAEGLLSYAGRQENSGSAEVAATLYREILNDSQAAASSEILDSVRRRAQSRLNALTGENAELGARAEVLLRGFVGQVTEPSALLAMGFAGAAFRASRCLALARLAANPSANFLTRGLGARGVAGLAGLGAEAGTFTLSARLGAQALGRSPDWSGRALGHDLASSLIMLGALRSGGVLSSALSRPIGQAPLRGLIHQSGMLAGILGAQRLEEIAGLRQARAGSSNLIEGFATLLQFNVAGRLARGLFGQGFQRMESGLETRSQGLVQANRGPSRPLFPDLGGGLEPAYAISGRSARPAQGRNLQEALEQQVFMVGKGERGESSSAKIDESGLQVIRGVRDLAISDKGDMWKPIRAWIEQQEHPIIVGELVVSSDLAQVEMINRAFSARLQWTESALYRQSVRKTFHSMSDSFVGSRVPLLALRLMTSSWVEYAPTRMRLMLPDGSPILVVGAGGIRNIQGKRIAFGIFTEIQGSETREAVTPAPVSEVRVSASVAPPRGDEAISLANSMAKNHFRNVQQALNSSNPPRDPREKK